MSHKQEDETIAAAVAASLKSNGHDVYLDVIDKTLGKNGDDLGDYLRERLSECDSLIAVISPATQGSWWVPWEIGVATEKNYPLSTYLSGSATPPEYLLKWPVLKKLADLLEFARLAKIYESRTRTIRLSQSKTATDAREISVPEFHRDLKQALGQK